MSSSYFPTCAGSIGESLQMATETIAIRIDTPDDEQEEYLGTEAAMDAPPAQQFQRNKQYQLNKGGGATVPMTGLQLQPVREGRPHSYTEAIQDQDVVQSYEREETRLSQLTPVLESPQDLNEVTFINEVHEIWSGGRFPEFNTTEVSRDRA